MLSVRWKNKQMLCLKFFFFIYQKIVSKDEERDFLEKSQDECLQIRNNKRKRMMIAFFDKQNH
jgi:hypothetical protein